MAPIRYAGLSPQELDELLDEARWKRWRHAEPDLRSIDSLADLRSLRGAEEDRLLGALVRLAAQDGGDDRLAAIAIIHQLGASIRVIARRYRHLGGNDIDGVVVGAMWEKIRSFDWHCHTRHYGAALTYGARRTVRRLLLPASGRVVPIDPQSWVFENLADASQSDEALLDSHEELTRFLDWALGCHRIGAEDVVLLRTLVAVDRADPHITKWLRGACSMAALETVAEQRGVCSKSIVRARDRALDRLRSAVPVYLDEIA